MPDPASTGASGATRRRYRPGDEIGIADLFRRCFDRDRPVEEWRWRFVDAPVEQVEIQLLEADGQIVGHVGRVCFPAWISGRRGTMRQSGDMMVAPEWRRRGGALELRSHHDDCLCDMILNFLTPESARVTRRAGQTRTLTRLTQWVRAHDGPGRLLAAAADRIGPRISVEPYHLDASADELAAASAAFAPCLRIRDARYLRWRWLDQPASAWRFLQARDAGGRLHGMAVFGVDQRRDPADVGRIVDMLALNAPTTTALLAAAAHELRDAGCRRVTFDFHDPRPWSRRACRRAGFLPRGQGLLVSCGSNAAEAAPVANDFANWYITRGDSDLC